MTGVIILPFSYTFMPANAMIALPMIPLKCLSANNQFSPDRATADTIFLVSFACICLH
jgi:hypothetical protein